MQLHLKEAKRSYSLTLTLYGERDDAQLSFSHHIYYPFWGVGYDLSVAKLSNRILIMFVTEPSR